jgi:peptidoglycan/xylan/chitin deacetylase (PgdA/CDA1 family)
MRAKALLNKIDSLSANIHLSIFGEQPGVSIFLIHAIFRDEEAIRKNILYPQERMTVALFRQFIEYFQSSNYQFLSPAQLLENKLDTGTNYALLTFDDGYYNNTYILDILKEYEVPALFFISTAYVTDQKKYWADIIYHERTRQGATDDQILEEVMALKKERIGTIYDRITEEFGSESISPKGDADRPLTLAELKEFACHPYVHIGNHTHEHEVLTNLSTGEMEEEIRLSQQILSATIGYTPDWISYPNGSYNSSVLEVCSKEGFTAGITTIQKKNHTKLLEANGTERLLLSRFNPVAVNGRIDYAVLRSSFQLKTRLKQWLQ